MDFVCGDSNVYKPTSKTLFAKCAKEPSETCENLGYKNCL